MLNFLPATIRGIIALSLLFLPAFVMAILASIGYGIGLLPIPPLKKYIHRVLQGSSDIWVRYCRFIMLFTSKTRLHVHGLNQVNKSGHYLMIANHRSWADILILQRVFFQKIPGLRFFMKKKLLWQLPLMGFAFKVVGNPVIERHSKEFLQKHPVTFINFIEGSRFSEEKHHKQNSSYKYLLNPRAEGLTFMMAALADQLDSIIDVTIIYPNMKITFWDFLCGKVENISIYIHTLPIKPELVGDYQNDPDFRNFFQFWLNEQWAEKDKFITNKLRSNIRNPAQLQESMHERV